MSKLYYIFRIFLVMSISAMWSCNQGGSDELAHHHHHESVEHDHYHEDDHDQDGEHHHDHDDFEIVLEHEKAEKFGVKTSKVVAEPFQQVIRATGQITSAAIGQGVVSAKSAGIIHLTKGLVEGKKVAQGAAIGYVSAKGISGGDANEAARVAYEAAKRELDRITPLHNDGIVSTKEYNEAKRIYDQANAAYTGSRAGSSATAPISGVVTKLLVNEGEYVDVGQQIAIVSKNTQLTLRVDLPEKYSQFVPQIKTANIRANSSDTVYSLSEMNGKCVSSTANTSEGGYIPVYFTFDNNGNLPSGSFVEVYLIGNDSANSIALPKDAIVEQQGKYYVYVQHEEDCYEKRQVTLGMDNGQKIEITNGLKEGETVVSGGAIVVHLAESSGAVPEGHTHNH